MTKVLKIYYLDENYINYLRKFDTKVAYNKNQTRPYIGIVYTFNGFNYFAPLSYWFLKNFTFLNNLFLLLFM